MLNMLKKRRRYHDDTAAALLLLLLGFPFGKFPLALLALEIFLDGREQTTGQGFKLSFGNAGTIDFWGSGIFKMADTSHGFLGEEWRG